MPGVIPEQRTYALSNASNDFLEALGVHHFINMERYKAYYWMQVWELQGGSYLSFKAEENKNIGRTVENNHLTAALYQRLKSESSIEFIFGDPIKSATRSRDGIMDIELQSGRKLETKLLVGCDGGNSIVKKLFNIPTFGWSHKQRAIVCTVKVDDITETLWQRFLKTGPLALLSMWGDYCSVVWSAEEDYYHHLMELSEQDFLEEMNKAFQRESEDKGNYPNLFGMIGDNSKTRPPLVNRS